MNLLKGSRIKAWVVACALTLVAGCWGTVWPQRSVVIRLPNANATFEDVQKFADRYLRARQFKAMGKAGYDAIKGTRTIFDYEGPDGLIVSVGPEGTRDLAKCTAVMITINQNSKVFSPRANKEFDALVETLGKKWPGAVTEKVARHKVSENPT